MTALNKFMFNQDFEDLPPPDAPKEEAESEQSSETDEDVEAAPTFSEEEVEMAREEGFAAGKEAGVREAAAATETQILDALNQVTASFADVCRMQVDSNREIARDMLGVASSIARKAFPDLNARNALGEIDRMVAEILDAILEEPKVQIFVAPELRDPLANRLEKIADRVGYEGRLSVTGDKLLEPGDCRVEWANGGAVRKIEDMWQQIDEIVERNLKGEPEFEVPEDMFAEPEGDDTVPATDTDTVDGGDGSADSPVSSLSTDAEASSPDDVPTAEAVVAETDSAADTTLDASPDMPPTTSTEAPFAPSVADDETDPEAPDARNSGLDQEVDGDPIAPVPDDRMTPPTPSLDVADMDEDATTAPADADADAGAPPIPTLDGNDDDMTGILDTEHAPAPPIVPDMDDDAVDDGVVETDDSPDADPR